ncbi:putative DNA polymerase zeta catalytic subunit [Aureobasidium pullulans]|uniref:DNA polymerase zeta catalytic subunit n=1 Tax=Aureobasidium pullulans TaxID=5580 RepID=A0A4S9BGG2_AURPU|nr:putative DNA polymerase zeta catalytic subunit [Aureobasidium pullulans]
MVLCRIRLNCLDHYQAYPGPLDPPLWGDPSLLSQRNLPQVPVVRVFGATETGQKVCLHIHGAFPYLYLEYNGPLDRTSVDENIAALRLSIDHALAVSYRRNIQDGKAVFVAHISLVKGVPYFGYHVGYKYFLKVYLLNPSNMTRLSDLLHQGAILKQVFQPYESHLQFLAQWMCDFNLYGCNYIDTDNPFFRDPVPAVEDLVNPHHEWHDRSIPDAQRLHPDSFPRQSHCSLEVDIRVQDILNREEVKDRSLHHDFVERLNHLAPEEKFVQSMAGLWRDETIRRKKRMGISNPGSSPFPPEVLVSMSHDPRNTENAGWIHEEEFRKLVEEIAKDERDRMGGDAPSFDTFVKPREEEFPVQTTLESVEELFHERWQITSADGPVNLTQKLANESFDFGDALVDEASILQLVSDEPSYESDEEVAREIALTQAQQPKQNAAPDVEADDETRPDGEDYAKQFSDPLDSMSTVSIPRTSQSIRDHEPVAPLSEAQAAGTPHGKKRQLTNGETSVKRRKVVGFAEDPQDKPEEVAQVKRKNFKVKDCATASQLMADGDDEQESDLLRDLPPASTQLPNSQDSSQRRVSQSYPTIKNPHDPDTMLRLSQRDDLPGERNPVTPAKSSQAHRHELSSSNWARSKYTANATPSKKAPISPAARKLASTYCQSFGEGANGVVILGQTPPKREEVSVSMIEHGAPPVIYQDAYYSDEQDVPERAREYAGQEFKLESNTVPFLPDFDATGGSDASRGAKVPIVLDKAKEELEHQARRKDCFLQRWEIEARPPSFLEVQDWMQASRLTVEDVPDDDDGEVDHPLSQQDFLKRTKTMLSQIEGPTQRNKHGFKFSQRKKLTSVQHEVQYMSIMSLEVHVNSRGDLAPDPEHDEISCIIWSLKADDADLVGNAGHDDKYVGMIVLSGDDDLTERMRKQVGVDVEEEDNELDVLNRLVDIVREYDPDILTGYEVHNTSWGYLIERARLQYEFNLCEELSRVRSQSHGRFGKDADKWGFEHTSTIRITGRHMINIWRAMRGELNLLQYTMENVVFHLLHKRIPHYSFADLTTWYKSSKPRDLAKALDYFITRVQLDLEILDANELVPRTSEQARLLGVDFFSVFSRGSQFKVESLMFRIAKPESFVLVSPSRKQVGQQNALECLPLVMEPQSAFYNSPLLVLDFQSLYPSVMIAYNYCYSTCLGRITAWRGQNKMGFTDFKREPGLLDLVKDKLNISPNGMMYVKPEMRKSLLAKMLGEILETRVMVKSGMKVDKDDKTLQQLLNNRQLALKLIANVTYGYTSASFSGRMPCSEIADSIVQTGRETLEKAIALIHSVSKWGAEVVYGDTDSLFVYLKGRSKDEAFKIGDEIAKAVTDMNPRPIKLKFEKVYHPCVLLAKKRYVGFKYEHPSQTEPDFDAKGIETVRRDGTPAEQKIEEKALKLLFRTADLSQVKAYFQSQCHKIQLGKFSIQDFCFAREVKLGSYSDKGPAPPGALIATKRMLKDPRQEPQYGERVPYVVIAGGPGARLFERCVEPERLLFDEHAELDAEYYISKNLIPPLERIFNLVGANVRAWWDEMPKVQRVRNIGGGGSKAGGTHKTMESYMATSTCVVCRVKLAPIAPIPGQIVLPLCSKCAKTPALTLSILRAKLQAAHSKKTDLDRNSICETTPGVNSFSGYVHLPSSLLADSQNASDPYNISTFFWYFESRNKPRHAPLTIWFAGGPGAASSFSAMTENGPCYINEYSNDTILNPYSLNENSNVLYIDQPVQAGFSYSSFYNSTYNFLTLDTSVSPVTPMDAYDGDVPPENSTFKYGVWADQSRRHTASTTMDAARPVWHFLQSWFENFPEYRTSDRRVNLWGNSYGGFWVTGFTSHILAQNTLVKNGTLSGRVIPINTIGITNGCVDAFTTVQSYGDIAYNNTYNTSFITSEVYADIQNNITKSGGCYDQIHQCRAAVALSDPTGTGINDTVNAICAGATIYCLAYAGNGAYLATSGRSAFDMAENASAPYPPFSATTYLNRPEVRKQLGVPVLFKPGSMTINNKFIYGTGDLARVDGIHALDTILDSNVNLALVFGDRDTRCNWLSGETVANTIDWKGKSAYAAAGYQETQTNSTYIGGLTKQFQSLSFTRVFQAGHAVGFFQPQTVFEIFERSSVWSTDVATGKQKIRSNGMYATKGESSAWSHFEVLPEVPDPICDIWDVGTSCSEGQIEALVKGTAVIVDDVVVSPAYQ